MRFGRRRGWSASYRRPGSFATAGPLVVVSRVDEFGDAAGAERSLAGVRKQLARVGRALAAPRVGDEALAFVQTRRGAGPPARFFTIAWRQDQLTATLRVSGFARGLGARRCSRSPALSTTAWHTRSSLADAAQDGDSGTGHSLRGRLRSARRSPELQADALSEAAH